MHRKGSRILLLPALLVLGGLYGCGDKPQSVTYLRTHDMENEGKVIKVRGHVKTLNADSMILWDGPQVASAPELTVTPCPEGMDREYIVDVEGKYDAEQSTLHMTACKVVEKANH